MAANTRKSKRSFYDDTHVALQNDRNFLWIDTLICHKRYNGRQVI